MSFPTRGILYAEMVEGTDGFLVTLSCGHKKATRTKASSYECRECPDSMTDVSEGHYFKDDLDGGRLVKNVTPETIEDVARKAYTVWKEWPTGTGRKAFDEVMERLGAMLNANVH